MIKLNKNTIKKTYFYTSDSFIFHIFGHDGENKNYIITNDNIEYLEEYINEYIEEYGHKELKEYLSLIKKELKKVDEVQFIKN